MRNAGLEEAQVGIKIAGRNIHNLRYADDTTLMAESEEELKSLLMKVIQESEKVGLKLNIQKTKIMASGPINLCMINRWGNSGNSEILHFSGFQNHCRWWLQQWNEKTLTPWKENYDQPRQHIKKQRHYFVNKGPSSQGYGFSSGHVWMWELDYKESWAPKNSCFWTVVLEKTLESPLDCKEIQPVHPKGDQSWVFIGRTDVEAETLATWCEELTHWKRPWSWERLGAGGERDDRGWDGWMASSTRWTWVWVDSGRWWWTGRPGGCNSWGHKELDTTELNWTEDRKHHRCNYIKPTLLPHVFFQYKQCHERV